jgi:hypothetical protein
MATFPGAIATFRTMVNRVGVVYDALKTKVIYAEDLNKHSEEINAIETTLGVNPQGGYTDVAERLDAGVGGGDILTASTYNKNAVGGILLCSKYNP